MTYGTFFLSIYSFIMGYEFTIVRDFKYLGGLVWLAIFSSVATFSSYLLLIGRIGASRAGYATVIFPVFALLISTIFEDYQWSTIGIIGVMLVVSAIF